MKELIIISIIILILPLFYILMRSNDRKPLKPWKLEYKEKSWLGSLIYRLFNPYCWKMRYYDFRETLWAYKTYSKIIPKMNDFDYSSIILMLEFQINILRKRMDNGNEVIEDRQPKLNDMDEVLKLLKSKLDDDYAERCGYDYSKVKNIEFVPVKMSNSSYPNAYEMVNNETEHEQEEYKMIYEKADELEEKEWERIFELLKNMRSWWD